MGKKNKHISHIIRIAVAVIAFLYFIIKNNPKAIANDFKELNKFVFLLALGLYAAGNLIFVLRWLILLSIQGIKVNYWPAVKLHLLGLFYNNALPGSVGGDVLRAWYVTKHTEKKIEAAMSVFVDRAVGLACTIAIIFLSYWIIPAGDMDRHVQFKFDALRFVRNLAIGVFALAALAAFVLFVMYKSRKLRPILFKYAFIFMLRWKMWSSRIVTAVKLYCSRPFTLLLTVIMTFVSQAMPIYGLYLVGQNLGIEAHIKYYYIFFPLSWIIGVIPISVGGAGVMELAIQRMFEAIDVFGKIPMLALAQRLTWILTSIPGVFIHLTGRHLPDTAARMPAEE